ncbi:hypothetical protein SDC9_172700 [bioreactor metagenome]|uniref:Uncharacterized protein n=1 Tax=bioreactor metagenome TaxID=1076179 RepID=A0A645GNL8_9ZZZZ
MLKHQIPRQMPVFVVDLLELVNIRKDDGERLPLIIGCTQCRRQILVDVTAVEQPGQRIL